MESGGSGAGSNGNGDGDGVVQKTCRVEERAVAGMGGQLTGDGEDEQMTGCGSGSGNDSWVT